MKIAINGLGRIGEIAFKIAMERPDVEVAAVNSLGNLKSMAYILRYDSVFGRYDKKVEIEKDGLKVGSKKVPFFNEPEPAKIPWKKMGVDVVLDCTGVFKDKEKCQGHLEAGAKEVIISAPPKDDTPIFCMGCNEKTFKPGKDTVISNGSCTTNCLAPVAKILNDELGIDKALMTTVHSYTSTQSLVDSDGGEDLRRGRAAALNLVPTSTGAAIAVTKVLPELKGRFDGMALRVPTPCVSVVDLVVKLRKSVTMEKVNNLFIDAARGDFKGLLWAENEPLVSSDFIGSKYSSVVDLTQTMVMGGDLVKVIAWYDNEWAYSERLVDLAEYVGKKI